MLTYPDTPEGRGSCTILQHSTICSCPTADPLMCAGSHWLAVEFGRHEGAGLHRSQSLCQRCGSGEVDDEAHMVFRCAALSVQRREHPSLFSPWPEDLRDIMGRDPILLASFVLQ